VKQQEQQQHQQQKKQEQEQQEQEEEKQGPTPAAYCNGLLSGLRNTRVFPLTSLMKGQTSLSL